MHCACLFFFPSSFNNKKAIRVKYCINYKNSNYAHRGLAELHTFREVQQFGCAAQPMAGPPAQEGHRPAFSGTETHGGAV